MFKIAKKPAYFWPVSIKTPADGGRYEKESFEVQFKVLKQSEIKSLIETVSTDEEFCRKIVCGWKSVSDESGAAIQFTDSAFDELLETPGVAKEIAKAYMESYQGAASKN